MLILPTGLATYMCGHYKRDSIMITTHYTRDDMTVRCHPYYMGIGPRYDWVNVLHARNQHHPCHVIAVVPGDHNGFDGIDVIMQCATERTGTQSTLFTKWHVDPSFVAISSDMISGSMFVLNLNGKNTLIAACHDYSTWPLQFTICP